MEYIEQISGTNITIENSNGDCTNSVKLLGNITQNGTPTPTTQQEIVVVTGVNTITVSDGTNTDEHTLDLGDLELCKIGNYQDYIYRDGVKWYLHKEIAKTVLTGDETWTKSGTRFHITLDDYATGTYIAISDYFKSVDTWSQHTSTNYSIILYKDGAWSTARLSINDSDFNSGTPFKQWLANNNVSVYYPSPDSINTEITDVDLIKQLNEIYNMKLPYGTAYITSQGDLPIVLDINYNNWNKDINPSDRAALLDGTATIETEIRYNMNGAVSSECSYYEDDSPYFVSCEFVQIVPNHQYNVDLSDILSNDVEEIHISILYSKNTPTDFDELNEWADDFYNTGDTSNIVDIIDMNDYQESSILLTALDDAIFMSLLITIKVPGSGGGGSLS